MPVKTNFLEEGVGVEFVAFDVLTGAEIIEANKNLYTEENLRRLKYKILDRSESTAGRLPKGDYPGKNR